jgi:hypothetical protein
VIAANSPSACLHFYSMDGNHVKTICEEGDSPGKYSDIRDFTVEPGTSMPITILDRNRMTNYVYEDNGAFLGGYRHMLYASAMHPVDERFLAMYCANEKTNNQKQLVIWDRSKNEIFNEFLEIDPVQRQFLNFFDRNNFLEVNDTLLFFKGFDNTIYQLTENYIQPRTLIDFGPKTLPKSFLERSFSDVAAFMEALRKTDYAFRIIGYHENDEFISFCFEHNEQFKFVLYDKQTKKYRISHQLIDDVVNQGLELESILPYGPFGITPSGFLIFYMEAMADQTPYANNMLTQPWLQSSITEEMKQNWEHEVDAVLLLVKPKRIL